MGWSEGTDLFWTDNENGSFTITEKKDNKDDSISSGSGSSGDTLHSTVEKIPPGTDEGSGD